MPGDIVKQLAWHERLAPTMLSLLRVIAGLLFLTHGTQKLFGYPSPSEFGIAPLLGLMGFAGILELVGGVLLTVGLFTRPVAFVLSGMMAVAYFMVHAPMGFFPILNHGELAVLFCFVFLLLSVVGPGKWSVDHVFLGRFKQRVARHA